MTAYFDVDDDTVLELLPAAMRKGGDELARLAARCEAHVLTIYTDDTSSGGRDGRFTRIDGDRAVFLDGYTIDAADCGNAAFKLALQRTIADVIAWQIRRDAANAQLQSSVSGNAGAGSAVVFRAGAADDLPPSWDRWLKPYDTSPSNYSL